MNFLAHAFLSPEDDEIMFGNVLGDFIKGRPDSSLSPQIWNGVKLHRRIDNSADQHPVTSNSIKLLAGRYRHYSRVILDVYHDYLLAQNFTELSGGFELTEFIAVLNSRFQTVRKRFPHVPGPDHLEWLIEYRSMDGVRASLARLSRRSRQGVDLSEAVNILPGIKKELENDFQSFFPEMRAVFCSR